MAAEIIDPGLSVQTGGGRLAAGFEVSFQLCVECGQPILIRQVVAYLPDDPLRLETTALAFAVERQQQWHQHRQGE